MITFAVEDLNFELRSKKVIRRWIDQVVTSENFELGPLTYIFCSDAYLHEMNVKYLNHDTLTDIISFDYSQGSTISGDLFISYERVKENATVFKTNVRNELHRVMIHGVLHLCQYGDKTRSEKKEMRDKEDFYLKELQTNFLTQ